MDNTDRKLIRVLFNASQQGRGLKISDLAEMTGTSLREARLRLEELAEDHYVHLNDARGARTAALLPAGAEALRATQVVVHDGFVQVGSSNRQFIDTGDDVEDEDECSDEEESDDEGDDFDDDEE